MQFRALLTTVNGRNNIVTFQRSCNRGKELNNCNPLQTQEQEGYGTQYEVQDFSLPSTSRREEQQQQQPIQVTMSEVFVLTLKQCLR